MLTPYSIIKPIKKIIKRLLNLLPYKSNAILKSTIKRDHRKRMMTRVLA